MAWTQADIDALKAALAKGEARVRFADREVAYRSVEEMRSALALMQAEVNAATGTARPRQRYLYQQGKGI